LRGDVLDREIVNAKVVPALKRGAFAAEVRWLEVSTVANPARKLAFGFTFKATLTQYFVSFRIRFFEVIFGILDCFRLSRSQRFSHMNLPQDCRSLSASDSRGISSQQRRKNSRFARRQPLHGFAPQSVVVRRDAWRVARQTQACAA